MRHFKLTLRKALDYIEEAVNEVREPHQKSAEEVDRALQRLDGWIAGVRDGMRGRG
ncbi:MAG: hypothetical protein Q7R68_11170 [Nitrospirales bacterium]|nr:hypothetical protein [Nitrospirales bacterium]